MMTENELTISRSGIYPKNKTPDFNLLGCKIGCLFCNLLIFNIICGMDGTRTRDPLRDRQVF